MTLADVTTLFYLPYLRCTCAQRMQSGGWSGLRGQTLHLEVLVRVGLASKRFSFPELVTHYFIWFGRLYLRSLSQRKVTGRGFELWDQSQWLKCSTGTEGVWGSTSHLEPLL